MRHGPSLRNSLFSVYQWVENVSESAYKHLLLLASRGEETETDDFDLSSKKQASTLRGKKKKIKG